MAIINPGNVVNLIFLLLVIIVTFSTSYLTKDGKIKPSIRRLPALDAIEEGVGRAAELGRPVHYTTGNFSITSGGLGGFPASMAGIALLGFVAELCAKQGVRLIDTVGNSTKYILEYETVREAFLSQGVPEAFRGEDIRYVSDTQHAYSSSVISTIASEECATNIMIGGFSGEAITLAEGGQSYGCYQVGGNPRTVQVFFFVVVCDYALIGEEVYAAGTALRNIPEEIGTIFGQDLIRYLGMALLILGTLMAIANVDFLYKLF